MCVTGLLVVCVLLGGDVGGMLVILLCELRFCWFVYECYDGLNL